MKKFMLPLLATSILSTISATAHAATASKEPGIYFYPAKTWVVGHADTPTDCAVQSEFNNGFVLQFDGNNKAVQSFTVNFRQNLFSEGQNYNMTVGVPGKVTKNISATATSGTMLTIPLQNNMDIYAAAKDNAVIDVTIDQNAFRFFLVNFAPAAKNFESCMTGKLETSPTAAPVAPVEATPIETSAPAQKTPAPQQQAAPAKAAPAPSGQPQQLIPENPNAPMEPMRDADASQPQRKPQPNNGIAPPPPNAAPEKIAANPEDMTNESIALEQREASGANTVPITEINVNDPQPVVQKMASKETMKVGAPIVEDHSSDVAQGDVTRQPFHKRMSEQLAEQMSEDPSMIAEDATNDASFPKPDGYSVQKQQQKIGLKEPPALEQPNGEIILPPPASSQKIAKQEPAAQPENMKTLSESAINKSQGEEVASIAAPKPEKAKAEPAKEDVNAQPSAERAEQLRQQAIAQLSQKPAPKAAPAPVVTATAAPTPVVETAEMTPPAETPIEEQTAMKAAIDQQPAPVSLLPTAPEGMAPHPSSTPFAGHYEKIETNPDGSKKKPQPEIAMTPPAPAPTESSMAQNENTDAATTENILSRPAPKTENFKTPEMQVSKKVYSGNVDLTSAGLDSVEPASSDAGRRAADPEMLEKISDLETKVHQLEKENLALNDELKTSVTAGTSENASISSENWNLERATMRYTEAERQMKRLGDEVQRTRAQCDSEKKDLEAQLFDPQITSQQQLARLADLEQKLATAQQQLADQRMRYEERIKILQSNSATQ